MPSKFAKAIAAKKQASAIASNTPDAAPSAILEAIIREAGPGRSAAVGQLACAIRVFGAASVQAVIEATPARKKKELHQWLEEALQPRNLVYFGN